MGQLFDLIRERNELSKPEDIHALNVFLTRLLFCFYAEDTGIFEAGQMTSAFSPRLRRMVPTLTSSSRTCLPY
jgi:hypothetical protein